MNERPILRILSRLTHEPCGGQKWKAICPAHTDNHESLSIQEESDGRVLLHCFAGCQNKEIVAALGLTMKDLFPQGEADLSRRTGAGHEHTIAATYLYRDENRQVIYRKVRTEPKVFYQQKPDGNGGWINKISGVKQVPYRLPELLEGILSNRLVWIVEGEKDADRLHSLGEIATTNSGGAGKWPAELNKHFAGARVVIIPDNDEPGRRHAELVATSLHRTAASVQVLRSLPGVPEKGDVSDYFDQGGTMEELFKIAEELPKWEQLQEAPEESASEVITRPIIDKKKLLLAGPPRLETIPEGFIRDFVDWASVGTDSELEFLFCSAIMALSAVCGSPKLSMKFGHQQIYTNLWLLLIAPSGFFRKTSALSASKEIIRETAPHRLYPDRLTPESFYETMPNQPWGVFAINEFGSWLKSFSKSYMAGFQQDLTELYDCPKVFIRRRKDRRGNIQDFKVDRPVISIYGATTIDWLNETLRESDAGSGFLPRFLFCTVNNRRRKLIAIPDPTDPAPEHLIRKLRKILIVGGEVTISKGSRAKSWYEEFFDWMTEQVENTPEGKKLASFVVRLNSYCLKFALIFEAEKAATRKKESTVITGISEESMQQAIEVTKYFFSCMKWTFKSELGLSVYENLMQRLLKIVRENGGSISRSQLLRSSHLKAREFDEQIKTLIERGELLSYEIQSAGGNLGGRNRTEYYLTEVV